MNTIAKYVAICLLVFFSSCSIKKNSVDTNALKEKECTELYGELETKEIHITQDRVCFFGFDPPVLPIEDTVVITVPNKINPNIQACSPKVKKYFAYNDGSMIFIWKEPSLSPDLEDELRKRMNNSWIRIWFPDSETNDGERFFVPETTVTEGVDENGLCWKTVNFEFMSYGYDCVPPEHKWYFDRILESFHKKTPSYQEVFDELQKELDRIIENFRETKSDFYFQDVYDELLKEE